MRTLNIIRHAITVVSTDLVSLGLTLTKSKSGVDLLLEETEDDDGSDHPKNIRDDEVASQIEPVVMNDMRETTIGIVEPVE